MQVIAIDKYAPHRKAMSLRLGGIHPVAQSWVEGVSVGLGDDVCFRSCYLFEARPGGASEPHDAHYTMHDAQCTMQDARCKID